jgi:hypothetical protein
MFSKGCRNRREIEELCPRDSSNRDNARMTTKPMKEVIELDERFERNRGEYLLVCYDGQSNSRCPVFRIGEAGEEIRKNMKGLGYDI